MMETQALVYALISEHYLNGTIYIKLARHPNIVAFCTIVPVENASSLLPINFYRFAIIFRLRAAAVAVAVQFDPGNCIRQHFREIVNDTSLSAASNKPNKLTNQFQQSRVAAENVDSA